MPGLQHEFHRDQPHLPRTRPIALPALPLRLLCVDIVPARTVVPLHHQVLQREIAEEAGVPLIDVWGALNGTACAACTPATCPHNQMHPPCPHTMDGIHPYSDSLGDMARALAAAIRGAAPRPGTSRSSADGRGVIRALPPPSLGNRSNHINPTHYGSPLDNATARPPINCRLDEDGLILDSFVWNPATGKMEQSLFMWCAPNLTRVAPSALPVGCPTDVPPGATTTGARPLTADGMKGSCFLSCRVHSDCGDGAVCANETSALNASMCSWPLAGANGYPLAIADVSPHSPPKCTCIDKPSCPAGQTPTETGNCGGHGQYPYFCCTN